MVFVIQHSQPSHGNEAVCVDHNSPSAKALPAGYPQGHDENEASLWFNVRPRLWECWYHNEVDLRNESPDVHNLFLWSLRDMRMKKMQTCFVLQNMVHGKLLNNFTIQLNN